MTDSLVKLKPRPPARSRLVKMYPFRSKVENGILFCKMSCKRCDSMTDWIEFRTMTEAKEGVPCKKCNAPDKQMQEAA